MACPEARRLINQYIVVTAYQEGLMMGTYSKKESPAVFLDLG
jgi:hypothetical protein